MKFLETVKQARQEIRQHGRLSLRAIGREFELDDEAVEEVASELVDVQRVVTREGDVLCWTADEPELEPVAQQAERRQLTVLFCDLVGSTGLAAGRDPEEWREIVRDYHQFATQIMERYEGRVAQFLGDGILVYFGYPQAHEDDPERAIRAGLGVIDGLPAFNEQLAVERGLRLSTRIGIHTGPVVVGEMGDGVRRETLALGDATNLAARLQDEAPPDNVVVSTDTLQLVRGIFVIEDLGHRALKGIPKPVAVHRVIQPTGVRSRLDLAQGHLTTFIGRDRELGLLLERWDQAVEGEGQTVLLSAEAGVGKSRLSLAVRERLADTPHTWLECRCSPYTQGSALRPLVELVERGLGFRRDDDAETRLRKIEEGVSRNGPDLKTTVQLFADLLDVPSVGDPSVLAMAPELKRERTLDALVAWVLALAEIQPVFLLAEDLHWCDPSSLELLGRLIEQLPTSRVLALLTARPEFEANWPGPTDWTTIALGRLRERPARELINAVSNQRPLPERAINQIVERSGGVALYLEELTLAALDSGQSGDEPSIPTTLQDSLMARLDRLSSAKEVAYLGAVIGREFRYQLIEAISDLDTSALQHGLRRLVDADVLFRRGNPPDATYTFRHALLQETAYGSLLHKRRQEIHGRIARAAEELFPERVEAQPEELARHHAEAANWIPAVEGYARAGERATNRSAYVEAVQHLTKGIELLQHLPESPDRSRRELALRSTLGPPLIGIRGYGNPEIGTLYERTRALSTETGDARRLYESVWGLANYHQARPNLPLALDLGRQLVEMALETDDSRLRSWAHLQCGATQFWMGDFHASQVELERSLASYEPSEHQFMPGAPDPCVAAWAYSAANHWHLGDNARALATSVEGIRLGREFRHAYSEALALCFAGSLHLLRGDAKSTRAAAEAVIPLASDHGFPVWRGWGGLLLGWSRALSGEADAGVASIETSLAEIAGTGTTLGAPVGLVMLAEAQQAAALWMAMEQTAEDGLALATRDNQHAWDGELQRLRAVALQEQHGPEDPAVEAAFQSAVDTTQRSQSLSYELRAVTSLADHWQRRGSKERAASLLTGALGRYPEDAESSDRSRAEELLQALA